MFILLAVQYAGSSCITENDKFSMVCLNQAVLETAFVGFQLFLFLTGLFYFHQCRTGKNYCV